MRRARAGALTKAQLALLLRGIDGDGNETISLDELEAWVLDMPEDGELEFGVALDATREHFAALGAPGGVLKPGKMPNLREMFDEVARRCGAQLDDDDPKVLATDQLKKYLVELRLDVGDGRAGGTKLSRRQVQGVLDRLDKNGDGVVTYPELARWVRPPRTLEQVKALLLALLDERYGGKALPFFRELDGDGGGDLSRLEVTAGMNRVGVGLQTSEITELVDAMDADGDRSLSTEELLRFLGKDDELAAAKAEAKERKTAARKQKALARKEKAAARKAGGVVKGGAERGGRRAAADGAAESRPSRRSAARRAAYHARSTQRAPRLFACSTASLTRTATAR